MNRGPVGLDTSSSHNSSVSCHRQLECSTGMTEGVSDHTTTSPNLSQHHPSTTPSTCLLVEPPSSSNPLSPRANRSVETNGKALPGSEDAAGAVLSKATSHLPLPLTPTPLSAPREPRPPSPWEGREGGDSPGCALLSACSSFEVSRARISTVFT